MTLQDLINRAYASEEINWLSNDDDPRSLTAQVKTSVMMNIYENEMTIDCKLTRFKVQEVDQ